jgi:quinol monooxygenase YgiN
MHVTTLTFRVQPHKRPEVVSAIDALARRMRTSTGCLSCRLYTEVDDRNTLTVISEWQDRAAVDLFFTSRIFAIFQGLRILLRGDPQIVVDDVRGRTRGPQPHATS